MTDEQTPGDEPRKLWRPTELGEVIAERELTFESEAGTRAVFLRFGRPVRGPEENDPWWCPTQVEGLDSSKVRSIGGSDSMQALLLAAAFARKVLLAFAEKAGGKVYWATRGHVHGGQGDSSRAGRGDREKAASLPR